MTRLAWICLGGAAGSGARYLVSLALLRLLGPSFPWGTLAVNLVGSFLLALLVHGASTPAALESDLRAALAIGVLGGFTTYSAFSYDTWQYLHQGAYATALGYVAATLLLGLGGCFAGVAAARWLAAG